MVGFAISVFNGKTVGIDILILLIARLIVWDVSVEYSISMGIAVPIL